MLIIVAYKGKTQSCPLSIYDSQQRVYKYLQYKEAANKYHEFNKHLKGKKKYRKLCEMAPSPGSFLGARSHTFFPCTLPQLTPVLQSLES